MDFTKGKKYVGFSHTEDGNRYWINQGWYYSEDCPGLFSYDTKSDIETANEVMSHIINDWKLKNVNMTMFSCDGIKDIPKKQTKNEVTEQPKKRGRKKKNEI